MEAWAVFMAQAAQECQALHAKVDYWSHAPANPVSFTFKHGRILPTGQVEALAQQQHVEN